MITYKVKIKLIFFSVSTNQSIFEDQPVSLEAVLMLLQASISPTFYAHLLHAKIPKVQKDSQVRQLFAVLGSVYVKAAHKHVGEIDPWWVNIGSVSPTLWKKCKCTDARSLAQN